MPQFCGVSFHVLEYFAGRARISRGYTALATDMVYDKNWKTRSSLHLNESAGFSLLGIALLKHIPSSCEAA